MGGRSCGQNLRDQSLYYELGLIAFGTICVATSQAKVMLYIKKSNEVLNVHFVGSEYHALTVPLELDVRFKIIPEHCSPSGQALSSVLHFLPELTGKGQSSRLGESGPKYEDAISTRIIAYRHSEFLALRLRSSLPTCLSLACSV
jgi:hypothetical protein